MLRFVISTMYPSYCVATRTEGAAGGFLLRGVWSAAKTGTSGASGGAGELTMDGRRAVAKRKAPREPGVSDGQEWGIR